MIKKLLLPVFATLLMLTALSTKAQTSFEMDYSTMDFQTGILNGDSLRSYLWNINNNYPNDSAYSLRFAAVSYDSLWQWNDNTGQLIASFPRATSTVRLDSFNFLYRHIRNVTTSADTLLMYVFDISQLTSTGTGASEVVTGPWIWRDSIIVTGSQNLSSQGAAVGAYYQITRRPNITLPAGRSFGVYIQFKGNRRNYLQMIGQYRNDCGTINTCGATPGIIPFTSFYYLNLINGANNLSGINPGIYYDCDGSTNYTPNGCELLELQNFVMSSFVTITGSSALTVDITQTNVQCFGQANGSATAVPTGGTGPYSYNWSVGSNNATITNLQPGAYSVTVVSNDGQTVIETVTITQPNVLTVSTSSTPSSGSNGTATATGTGGTTPYSYSWNNGQTSQTATGLAANVYVVTITDANNCSASATVSVQSGTVTSSCDTLLNVDFGALTYYVVDDQDPTAGYLSGNNVFGDLAKAEQFTSTAGRKVTAGFLGFARAIDGGAASSVTVKIWDATGTNGSPGAELDAVTVPLSFIISAINQSQLVVVNFPNEPVLTTNNFYIGVELPTTPGDTLVLLTDEIVSNGPGRGWEQTSSGTWVSYNQSWFQQPSTLQFGNAIAASVCDVTTTPAACTPDNNVTQGWSPNSAGVGCASQGQAFQQIYTFVVPSQVAVPGVGNVPIDSVRFDNITNLPSGLTWSSSKTTYLGGERGCFIVNGTTNAPCGQYIMHVLVTFYNMFAPSGLQGDLVDLATQNSIPGFPEQYLRVNGAGNSCPAVNTSQTADFVADPTCGATSNLSVTIAPTHVNCFGQSTGSATATATGGTTYTYQWSTGGSTSATLSGLAAGTYSVTVTSNGQTASASVNITQPSAALNVSVTTTATSCSSNTGTATANVTGGTPNYTYSWTGGGTGSSKNNLAAGNYNVTVTDSKGCSAVASGTVGSPASFNVSVTTTDALCFGQNSGSAVATATGTTGQVTYTWSNSSTGATLNNIPAGTYSVTVQDGSGCTKTASGTVAQPSSAVTASATATQSSCSGSTGTASVTANGGTPGYTYNWSNNATGTNLTNLAPGTYNVTVSDSKGCTATASANVGSPATFNLTANATNALCFGQNSGSATVNVTGGTAPFTYTWSNGSTTATANALVSGNYTVTVGDASGCAKSTSVSVGQPTAISTSTTTTNSTCGGATGSATVTATGGTPGYTYLWSTGGTSATVNSLAAGNYSVTVRDNNQCVAIANATIIAPSTTTITISATDVVCYGAGTGAALASVTGGTTPYSYAWSTGATTQGINNVAAGTYIVTVTDGGGCSKTASVIINQPATPLTVSVSAQNSSCGASTGSVTATVSGNTGNPTYQWSANANNATTASVNNLGSGLYSVTVSAGGCQATASIAVNNSNGPTVVLLETHPSCFNSNDGQISTSVSGGTGPYTYTWTGGGTSSSISGLDGGTYTVVVKDATNCQATAFVTLVEPTAITLNANVTGAACNGSQTGSISLNVAGGTAPYAYSWSASGNTSSVSNLLAGTYSVTVTDSKSCTVSSTINVTEPVTLTCTTTSTATVGGGNTGTATAAGAGGTAPYTYVWSNSQTGPTITGLGAGTVTVTITDSKGCTATASASVIVSGISDLDGNTINVALFPNPANETINVVAELENTHNTEINITDITGKLVFNTHESVNGKLNRQINVRGFNSGVYIMEIIVDKQAARKRFVVSH